MSTFRRHSEQAGRLRGFPSPLNGLLVCSGDGWIRRNCPAMIRSVRKHYKTDETLTTRFLCNAFQGDTIQLELAAMTLVKTAYVFFLMTETKTARQVVRCVDWLEGSCG